jgi:hypothetical protein
MKRYSIGAVVSVAAFAAAFFVIGGTASEPAGEVLYNGIQLPAHWPPRVELTLDPQPTPPYLVAPPAVIPIDVGRQLFVDDFLIEKTDLKRTYHAAKYIDGNPVLKPDKPWETDTPDPCAMVFSDGVWFDPKDSLFKMWYMGGYVKSTCYATSKDGIHWEKPALDVVPGTNVVHPGGRDSATVWLDLEENDPLRRFKFFRVHRRPNDWGLSLYCSPDGIHWGDAVTSTPAVGDRTTVFYNPFRKVWVFSIRHSAPGIDRVRRYREHPDAIAGATWRAEESAPWVGADRLDPMRDDLKTPPQLYNLDCVAYESLLLGLFSIWYGQPNDRPKPNEVCLGFSRDGFHWSRPSREAFIGVSERQGDWNWGNVQSAGGGCLVVGDELYFFVSARAGVAGQSRSGVCATGLAKLRRDGFASMDAGDTTGTLTTRPVRFSGKYLLVNADVDGGELRAEILDEAGHVIEPYTLANSMPVKADKTVQTARWKDVQGFEKLAGQPVRFRFHLRNGSLYAFWVATERSGASRGYVAAGGPGFTGPTDTVGSHACKECHD